MNKEELRNLYLKRRKELEDEQLEYASAQICERFFTAFDLSSIGNIHIFLPIAEKKEVNTWLIIERIQKQSGHINIVVPKSDLSSGLMYATYLREPVNVNKWGIPEPEGNEVFPASRIDMMLLPVLVVDKMGNRVGYGKGFYDKYLENCPIQLIKIGLSIFDPIEKTPSDPHDIPLDYCITPSATYDFTNRLTNQ